MSTIYFEKMNALGNEFVLIDARKGEKMEGIELSARNIKKLANKKTRATKGCDQLLILRPSEKTDCFMEIYNKDGSEAEACLNGTRAAMLYLYLKEGKTRMDYTISTNADSFTLSNAHGKNKLYEIEITLPKTTKKMDRELPQKAKDIIDKMMFHMTYGFVDVGNPHIVFFVEVEGAFELDKLAKNYGYALEQAIDPENGINVSFACQDEKNDQWVHLR
ncbi:MAG: diaminopimelate epimerase, partial [Parvibaculales bacterium]